jgi:cellulase (glycosyl hydrolase family 5)
LIAQPVFSTDWIYDTDGNEQDLAAAFRELNAALDQTQTLEPVPATDSSK